MPSRTAPPPAAATEGHAPILAAYEQILGFVPETALTMAFHAGQHPNAVTDHDIEACRVHFDDDEITRIVAVRACLGFLNRWNDSLATTLEPVPLTAAGRHLADRGWSPGTHQPVDGAAP